jgi:anti-sigma regulatory factor (Ser/Thr protein kinase)
MKDDDSAAGRSAWWKPQRGTDVSVAAQARAWARRMLPRLLQRPAGPRLEDDLELLLSEVTSNALRYGRGVEAVRLRVDDTTLRLSVRDFEPRPPVLPRDAGLDTEADHGRGLILIDALAARWGVLPHPDDGKDVWFELTLGASR